MYFVAFILFRKEVPNETTYPLLLCILLLIPVLAVTASADAAYSFEWQYVEMFDEWYFVYPGTMPNGEYNIALVIDDGEFVSLEPLSVEFMTEEVEGVSVDVAMFSALLVRFPLEYNMDFTLINMDGITYLMAGYDEGHSDTRIVFTGPGSDTPPVASVTDTLNTVIDWVGTVTTSLLSGELNGLLLLAAIPIAIAVVMLSVKIIRRNVWGL